MPVASILLSMGVNNSPTAFSNVLQVITAIGGLLGFVALATLPWTVRKIRAETRSIEVSTEVDASDVALKHLQIALDEADRTIQRIKNDAETKIAALEQQVDRLIKSLEAERARSEEERKLHEQRVVGLLYDLRARDSIIETLKAQQNYGSKP